MVYSDHVRRWGRCGLVPGKRRPAAEESEAASATAATTIPGTDRRNGWAEGEGPTRWPRVLPDVTRPYVRTRRERKLEVRRGFTSPTRFTRPVRSDPRARRGAGGPMLVRHRQRNGSTMRHQQATLRFLGATDTVTGSRYLIESGGNRVLVDCGRLAGAWN